MKRKIIKKNAAVVAIPNFDKWLDQLRILIQQSRQQVLHDVDVIQVRTYWEIGRHFIEFEQGGAARAQYGVGLLARIAERLSTEFGKGFDKRNLRHIGLFIRHSQFGTQCVPN